MQRYFTAHEIEVDDLIEMSPDDTHHMKNVMRMTTDDTVELVDNKSQLFVAKIELIDAHVHLKVLEAREDKSELPVETTLFIPLLKGHNHRLLLTSHYRQTVSSALLSAWIAQPLLSRFSQIFEVFSLSFFVRVLRLHVQLRKG